MTLRMLIPGLALVALLAAGAVTPVCLADEPVAGSLSDEERKAGFKPMFNGRDWTGWRFSGMKDGDPLPENWVIENGLIRVTGGGRPHLITADQYANFEMRFEWRSVRDKYNSGFFIRTGPNGGTNQLNLAKGAEGKFIGGKVEGDKAVPELQKPAGEWNEWRVRVTGDKVAFECNGKPAWEATGLKPDKGQIGLQAEGAALEFRNLRILVLP